METVVRVVIIYLMILFGLRVLGKREFGQLSPLELVTLLLIPELVAQALVREDFSMTNAIIALTTLFSLVFVTSVLGSRFRRFQGVIEGSPSVLAYHGKLVQENLMEERVSPEEIYTELRKAGLEDLSQVRWAILETDGKISIVPASEQSTAARKKHGDIVT